MFLPFQALDATRDLARSALPDAAVVEHVPDAPRRVGALRLGLAKTLHALAGRIADEAAFCSAERVTLTGSLTPAASRSS